MSSPSDIYQKVLNLNFLSHEEAMELYQNAATPDLMFLANEIRKKLTPEGIVGWQIDRNVNITNVCVAQCKFCNFYRRANAPDTYITTIEEYKTKIDELYEIGGRQVLLQGGLHPKLGLAFYEDLFSSLKSLYPDLKLHALGPAEIHHIARKERMSYTEVLTALRNSGLDSLPGAGAEILTDRVRSIVSKGKCNSKQWLDVMRAAHQMDMLTSATMMFGHIETIDERITHLLSIRDVQAEKPEGSTGFISFIPWPFQDEGTELKNEQGVTNTILAEEYIRTIAMSRILLPNIKNIQASWLTVGTEVGKICLHAGANDFGSIMIEENVVSVAGASYNHDKNSIQVAIQEAGFTPKLRNQRYEYLN
ncbi:MAG: dehypoxanthine futalosine cyclase [Bacteroidales bacterium]|nr:dehypoxanthine futalosine cyclase [Bacteroidales bacterium]